MSKIELLEQIIRDFNRDTLIQFYKLSSDKFRPESKDFSDNLPKDDERFENIEQIGRIEHEKKAKTIAFFISSVSGEISERDSKKKQYDIGKKILKDNYLDAGIFVFYGNNNFRLSLIAASYSGPRRKFTTFKRYTYFVSPDLTNKTFKDQLKKCDFSSIEKILESFSIEAVNKDFYTQIALKFTELTGGWRKVGSKKVEKEACMKLPDTMDEKVYKEFAVRLIGRLIFCWFLKKKMSDRNIPLIPEGILSSAAVKKNKIVGKYYHGVLEPLFFELLNTPQDKRKKEYKKEPWSLIPFLNGGLFTPNENDFYELSIDEKSKHINTLIIPDDWLKELLEIYERYNFTIDENTPVDIELSIEPEMLGRIFENLLAEINPETGETARKSTGSYYTPRAIVEYMVDESLKQYLITKTGVKEKNIVSLLSYAEDDSSKLKGKEAEAIIQALHDVRIIDPACGSGAFPIGILQKILLILQKLDPDSRKWLERMLAKVPDPLLRREWEKKTKLPNYLHKLGIIRDCIFGVDIQSIAVEISKLRCFLSLIVDEIVNDGIENRGVEHLPNLEFKFVCANTLIGLPKAEIKKGRVTRSKLGKVVAHESLGQTLMFEASDKISRLKELRDSYLRSFGQEKKQIEKQFRRLQSKMFEYTLDNFEDSQTAKLSQWEPFEDKKCDWFEAEWMFGIKNGFDIVIGNPPYVEHKKLKPYSKLFKANYKCYAGTADLYIYFIEKSISLLKQNGTLSFITSNKFIKTSYGEKIRKLLSEKNIANLIDFTKVHVFDALVASCVLIVNNYQSSSKATVVFVDDEIKTLSLNDFVSKYYQEIDKKQLGGEIWLLESSERLKIKELTESGSTCLGKIEGVQIFRGVTTGYNPAFIIDDEKRKELIFKDKKNKEVIKPLLQGRNIKKWSYIFSMQYMVFTRQGIEIDKYPSVKKYLNLFYTELKPRIDSEKVGRKPGRYNWYEIQDNTAYYKEFEKEKIIWGLTADKWAFAYDNNKHYLPSNGYILTSAEISIKYLLALLNSRLMEFYFSFEGIMTAGGAYTLKHETIEKFPIKLLDEQGQKPFLDIVDRIMAKKEKDEDVTTEEAKIDEMVYELYGLADNEIAIIKDLVNMK